MSLRAAECTHRHGNGEVGLSGTGRTNAEYHGIPGDGADVAALSYGAGADALPVALRQTVSSSVMAESCSDAPASTISAA